jgi:hypothetical protein
MYKATFNTTPLKVADFSKTDAKAFKKFSLYKRAWRIIVIPRNSFTGYNETGIKYKESDAIVISDSTFGDAALHCKFNVNSAVTIPTYGDITVYNMSKSMINQLAAEGARVVVEAGYLNGVYGQIWNGNVFHFIEYRENVVDRVLTMHCLFGKDVLANNFLMASLSGEQTRKDRFEHFTKLVKIDVKMSKEILEETNKTARRIIEFGDVYNHIRDDIALEGRQLTATKEGKLTDANFVTEVSSDKAVVVSPDSGLIGLPTQIPKGVSFQTLLDPRLIFDVPPRNVILRNTEVKGLQQNYNALPPMLDSEGQYRIISVNHRGDTRGGEWYSFVESVVNPEMILALGPGESYTFNGLYNR